MGFVTAGNAQGYRSRPPKKYKPTKQTICCTNLHGIVWNSFSLDYSELSNILPKDVMGQYLTTKIQRSKTFDNLVDEAVKNFVAALSLKQLSMMNDDEIFVIPDKNVFGDNNRERKTWVCLG